MPTICLNMIVRNEAARIERCLASVAPYISEWCISDTGSTDETVDIINRFFLDHGIKGSLIQSGFDNFGKARNSALAAARTFSDADYILFMDADMELKVDDPDAFSRLNGTPARLIQKGGGLSYYNTRLLPRSMDARYVGVTHEYLDTAVPPVNLDGAYFIDHADGANREGKFKRDIDMLERAIRDNPKDARSWYYLAQSYRDDGKHGAAVVAYKKRAEMGGWEEESWSARLNQARCYRALAMDADAMKAWLGAYAMRPTRAEPLYDLARYHREKGSNAVASMFAREGLRLPRPDDLLFVEDNVYAWGLFEELSIAGFYSSDPSIKAKGRLACEHLALARHVPQATRELARSNLFYYMQPMAMLCPSFSRASIDWTPPEGWTVMNPSITRHGGRLVMIQRTVNYQMDEMTCAYPTPDGAPITTRNWLLDLRPDLRVEMAREIRPIYKLPPPLYGQVLGFEDARLFSWRGKLYFSATARQFNADGRCEQWRCKLRLAGIETYVKLSEEDTERNEKNWMPLRVGEEIYFLYGSDPTLVIDRSSDRGHWESVPPIAADHFRGGTQLIAFDDGWLGLIHEVLWREDGGSRRHYVHRFIWLDKEFALKRWSDAFYFHHRGVEFAAGLCEHPDGDLLISYGVSDRESWIGKLHAADVRLLLHGKF